MTRAEKIHSKSLLDGRGLVLRSIMIVGRRWFQRSYGNTYNTAEIWVNGVYVTKTPKQYGYGDHYRTCAGEWLVAHGYIKQENVNLTWSDAEKMGITLNAGVSDVAREKDL